MSEASYREWRRTTVPFTDEQIAVALEAEADVFQGQGNQFMARRYRQMASATRAGFLSARAYSSALPALVKWCAICGAPALYRYGSSGRCRKHRHAMDVCDSGTSAVAERQRRNNAAGHESAAIRAAHDRAQQRLEAFRRCKQGHA